MLKNMIFLWKVPLQRNSFFFFISHHRKLPAVSASEMCTLYMGLLFYFTHFIKILKIHQQKKSPHICSIFADILRQNTIWTNFNFDEIMCCCLEFHENLWKLLLNYVGRNRRGMNLMIDANFGSKWDFH